ncbi:MAG: hypothetical protein ACPGR8_17145, partial [Limisphaerales bacterium]
PYQALQAGLTEKGADTDPVTDPPCDNNDPYYQCNYSQWNFRRYQVDGASPSIHNIPPSASVDTTPICPAQYFCPPGPCMFMEVDYQNYDPGYNTTMIGAPSCGPVFGRSVQINLKVSVNVVPDAADHKFYPGSVVSQLKDTQNRVSGLTRLKRPHPRFAEEPVPVWAPIDGLGELTGEFDFVLMGDTAFPSARSTFGSPASTATGSWNITAIAENQFQSPILPADFEHFKAQCLESGVDTATTAIRISFYTKLSTVTLQCRTATSVDIVTVPPAFDKLANETRIVDFRRAADFSAYRSGSLAGNLPIYTVTNGESEKNLMCGGDPWKQIEGLEALCEQYGYSAQYLKTCQCFIAQVRATQHLKNTSVALVPVNPGCCKWVKNAYIPAGSNYKFPEGTHNATMALGTNIANRNDQLKDAAQCQPTTGCKVDVDGDDKLNNYASLIAYEDEMLPCCPWFELDGDPGTYSAVECVKDAACQSSPTPRCTMTAQEVVDAFNLARTSEMLERCQRKTQQDPATRGPFTMKTFNNGGDFVMGQTYPLPGDQNARHQLGALGAVLGEGMKRNSTTGGSEFLARNILRLQPGQSGTGGLSDELVFVFAEHNDTAEGSVFFDTEDNALVRTIHGSATSIADPCGTLVAPTVSVTALQGASEEESVVVSLVVRIESKCATANSEVEASFWCHETATVLSA